MSWPHCPACHEPAPWGTFPPSLKGDDWWCNDCLNERIRRLRKDKT